MAESIANLAVILSANASQFTAGMRGAGVATQQFSVQANGALASVGASMASVGRLALRLGPLIGIGLGIGAITGELQRLDDAAKDAAKIGDTAENISRLQFAAEQTGSSVETLDKGLESMTRRISEATTGTGEAKDALAELGLNADELNRMAPTQAFAAIADKMVLVKNQADKVRLTYDLFGRSGLDLVNVLDLGSEGLAEFAKQSDRLGNTIDGGAAKSAEEFNDTVNELKRSLGGLAVEVLGGLTPAIKSMVAGLRETVVFMRSFNAETVKNVVQISAMAAAALSAVSVAGKFIALGASIITTIRNITKAAATMQVVLNPTSILKIAAGIAAAVAVGVAVEEVFEGIAESSVSAAAGIEGVGDAAESSREKMQRLTDEAAAGVGDKIMGLFGGELITGFVPITDEIVSQFDEITKSIERMTDRASQIFESTRTPTEQLAAQLKEIAELTEMGFLDPDTARRAREQLQEAVKPRDLFRMPEPTRSSQRVDFAAMGAAGAAGFGKEDKIEKNTAEEVKESKKQTATLADLLRFQRNSQGAAITIANF